MTSEDLVVILRQKAKGQRNECGDFWHDGWCADAADRIEQLEQQKEEAYHRGHDEALANLSGL